jgi:lipid-binding SYLF domain-containing protein
MVLEGGNFGYQIDRKSTDLILLVMNDVGANDVLASEVKLGADASSAAGPVGRELSAESCEVQQSKILSYARVRGKFWGVSLSGTTIRPDNGNNHRLYGRKIPARDITLSGAVAALPAAGELISTLETKSPQHRP